MEKYGLKGRNIIQVKARAKINLAIDVLGKRQDGYHDLKMVMQSIALSDELLIKKVYKKNYLKIVSNLKWLPVDESNLVWNAARYLFDKFNINEGVFIELNKKIPVSAGLGGGSADCAATLTGLRDLFNLPLSDKDLMEIGLTFGADVPFCLMRGTAVVEGIGEQVRKIAPMPHMYVVLVKPHVIVSTASVFKEYDLNAVNEAMRPNVNALEKSIQTGDLMKITPHFKNTLESVTIKKHPIIGKIKEKLNLLGGLGTMMSGSGATVFALFNTKKQAYLAAKEMNKAFPSIRQIIVTELYRHD